MKELLINLLSIYALIGVCAMLLSFGVLIALAPKEGDAEPSDTAAKVIASAIAGVAWPVLVFVKHEHVESLKSAIAKRGQ